MFSFSDAGSERPIVLGALRSIHIVLAEPAHPVSLKHAGNLAKRPTFLPQEHTITTENETSRHEMRMIKNEIT